MSTTAIARAFYCAVGVAALAITTAANAAVHRVFPGESIQAAIDVAAPGDTILVEPGEYRENADSQYGLRIATDNLRLIGKVKDGQMVRLIANGRQETGIYAAPAGCEYRDEEGSCEAPDLQGFYLRGFSVEEFPVNGIQTRWVNDFCFIRNYSVNNLNNGIYPTLSTNGLVRNNVSYGSLDTAMWVAGSENVRVIGNDLSRSTIGFEITVANNVWVTQNKVYNNTVGIGLFHPNAAGNPPMATMANWVIERNDVRDNNLPNPAVPGTFQKQLPSGIGILLLGVSENVISRNHVEDNDFVGIGVLGWCVATGDTPYNCGARPPIRSPEVSNNLVSQNHLSGNGTNPPANPPFPPVDILYVQAEGGSGNCFEKNKPNGFSFFSWEPPGAPGPLPTDGCMEP
jgi:hypothetical protein